MPGTEPHHKSKTTNMSALHDHELGQCHHAAPGYAEKKAAYLRRLKLVEGQIRGLQRLIDEDTYCIDVLTQVSAAVKALQSLSLLLVEDHLHHCVKNAAASGDGGEIAEKLDEVLVAFKRLM